MQHFGCDQPLKKAKKKKNIRGRLDPAVVNFSVGTMDNDQQLTLQVHVTIQKGFSVPPLQRCKNCCFPSKYHCPFCSPVFFKPAKRYRAMVHMDNHVKEAIYVGEDTIHRCGLQCRKQLHYHCLYCTTTVIKKDDFLIHLPFCRQLHQRTVQNFSHVQTDVTERLQTQGMTAASLTSGESDNPIYNIESDNDSDEITVIPDSDDQNSQGESSRQSVTPIIPKSKDFETVDKNKIRRSTPDTFKCHRTVQTNTEKPQDCDEYYFMSLVKLFKKLSPQKKADVRMKIERLLFEAECE